MLGNKKKYYRQNQGEPEVCCCLVWLEGSSPMSTQKWKMGDRNQNVEEKIKLSERLLVVWTVSVSLKLQCFPKLRYFRPVKKPGTHRLSWLKSPCPAGACGSAWWPCRGLPQPLPSYHPGRSALRSSYPATRSLQEREHVLNIYLIAYINVNMPRDTHTAVPGKKILYPNTQSPS